MPRHRFTDDPSSLPIENPSRLADFAQRLHQAQADAIAYSALIGAANDGLSKSERAFVAGYLLRLRDQTT